MPSAEASSTSPAFPVAMSRRGTRRLTTCARGLQAAIHGLAVLILSLGLLPSGQAATLLNFGSVPASTLAAIQFVLHPEGDFIFAADQGLCPNCVTVSSPASVAGTYNFALNAFDMGPVTLLPANPTPGVLYSQEYEGANSVSISNGNGQDLIGGACANFTFIAAVGSSAAVIQCEFQTSVVSNLITLPSGPLYLIFAGSTSSAVGTQACSDPPCSFSTFGAFTLDWSGVLSTTPYAPQNFVTVPNVVSDSQSAASSLLANDGLSTGAITMQSSTTVSAGAVISQSPAAGTSVPGSWPVDLVVSSGPPLVSVPNVVGLSQSSAIAALQAAGFKVTTVTLQTSTAAQAGLVTAQTPSAGTGAAAGSAVNLNVGAGPPSTPSTLTYTGDKTSYFNYQLYDLDGAPFEAFVQPEGDELAVGFGVIGAGGVSSGGNPVFFSFDYVDATGAVTCSSTVCSQPLKGSGTLTITTCAVNVSLASPSQCVSSEGHLGGSSDAIFAGASLAALNSNSVTTAVFQFNYTQTQSYDPATGITTYTPDAPAQYVIISGNSGAVGVGPGATFAASPVQLCYGASTPFVGGCGPLGQAVPFGTGTYSTGPYFSPFAIDWTLVVSAAPYSPGSSNSITVPDLVGLTQSGATAALSEAGLVPGTVTQQSSTTVAAGNVISQSPAPGASVSSGAAVSFVVSTGPPMVTVPNLVGDSQSVATAALTSDGLTVGTIGTQFSLSAPAGSVLTQSPAANSSVLYGTAVNLVLATPPAESAPPVPSISLNGAPQFTAEGSGWKVTVPLINNGTADATTVTVSGASTLAGQTTSGASGFLAIPTLTAGGGTGNVVLLFPSVPAGATVLKISGSYQYFDAGTQTGNYNVSARVSVP